MSHASLASHSSRILVAASWGLGEFVESMGGDKWRVFRNARLKPSDLRDPLRDISVRQHCDLFEASARETGLADLGMRFGESLQPRLLGPIGYLAASAPTLRAALETLCAYHPAHQSGALLSLSCRDKTAALTYRVCDAEVSEVRQETEMTLTALCNIIRQALGACWSPDLMCFAHSRIHSSFRSYNVRFDRPSNSIYFRVDHLDTAMPSADPYMAGLMRSILEKRRRTAQPATTVECVRQRIELCLGEGVTTLERVAAQMGMNEYRVSTQLARAGTSFNELLKEARCALALRYLRDESMQLTEISLQLGYSELSAFSRAFRKWAGVSPQTYRRGQVLSCPRANA
jgi:AraC-like DNA-binding protein